MQLKLAEKYNIPVPRYTSYPPVPDWSRVPDEGSWRFSVCDSLRSEKPLSIYIHLPFCESLCTYCGCNTRITVNHAVETPYIDSLLAEWEMYRSMAEGIPVVSELHLGGGTPTFFSPQSLDRLLTELLKNVIVPPDAAFSFEAHPANTTHAHIEVLYRHGFRRLSLGIQDFDPQVQAYINRKQSYQQVAEVTRVAREIGYDSINYDLIYGLPKQSTETIQYTVNKVITLCPDRIAFYSYAHVPWMRPAQKSFDEAVIPVGSRKLELYLLGRVLLQDAGYTDIGMDHFALPNDELYRAWQNGTLHRNFMGFTTFGSGTLIGLGASSISDTGNCMIQNYKHVEDYQAAIAEGKFPIERGHLLNASEIDIRKTILKLLCTGEAELPRQQMLNLDLIEDMILDNLVHLEGGKLRMTPSGRPFTRIAASAFDPLRKNSPGTSMFSKAV